MKCGAQVPDKRNPHMQKNKLLCQQSDELVTDLFVTASAQAGGLVDPAYRVLGNIHLNAMQESLDLHLRYRTVSRERSLGSSRLDP